MRIRIIAAVVAIVGCVTQVVPAAVIYIREGNATFAGNAVTLTTWDDAGVSVTSGAGSVTNSGSGSNLSTRTTSGGIVDSALYATKNLFTLVPATSGGDTISITSAKLHLYANSSFPGDANSTVRVSRVTTNWLVDAAGVSEGGVSGKWVKNSTSTPWSNAAGFGAGDFTTTGQASLTWNGASNALNSFDVTSIVSAMYANNANYGFVVATTSVGVLSIRASEQTANITPVLEISYTYVPEPASLSLLGVAAVGVMRRRRSR